MQWTEKQMETWLTPSVRTLIDRHGDAIVLEQCLLFWEEYDFLIDNGHFTHAELIDLGHATVDEFKLPFPLGIQDAVAHLYNALTADEEGGSP